MKVLIYTSSFDRPKMLRSCIQDAQSQTYNDILHVINLTAGSTNQIPVINDLFNGKTHIVMYPNGHSHVNNMNAIMSVHNYMDFDLFVKFDDDDIHKKDYVQNIVNHFEQHPECDVVSTCIKHQLNGNVVLNASPNQFGGWVICNDVYDNLTGNPEGTDYHMPMTFAFNKKALLSIMNLTNLWHFDDVLWREKWAKDGIIHQTVHNEDQVIWYVHANNISMSHLLKT